VDIQNLQIPRCLTIMAMTDALKPNPRFWS
jgi:hypothetical protein